MPGVLRGKSRILVALVVVPAIALAGCGGGSSAATNGGANNGQVSATGAAKNGGDTGLSGSSAVFSKVNSYTFSMTLAGGSYGSMLSLFGGSSASGNAPFTISGTAIVKPTAASDIKLGDIEMIDVDGYSYMNMGGTLGWVKTPSTGSGGTAEAFSPAQMFSSSLGSEASGYKKVGSESKNGQNTDHYQASSDALAEYSSILGAPSGDTWSADVWIISGGDLAGLPVSMLIEAKSATGVDYEMAFDISNINSPSNSVTAPANATGA